MRVNSEAETKKILLESLKNARSVCILTHKNPDGDGLPVALALQEILKHLGYKADVVLEAPASELYDYLQADKRTKVFSSHFYYDMLILLDCHEESRLGVCTPLIPTASKIIAIDHHMQQELIPDSVTLIETHMVSAGAIIYNMFSDEIKELPKRDALYIAEAIYTTIINDTDNFLNANVDSETFRICSELMNLGIDPGKVTTEFLLNKSANYMRYIGDVLATIETYDDDQILFMNSSKEMLQRNHLTEEATSKLSRWIKGTKKVKASICFQEVRSDRYRLSLRSNYIDVNRIAVKYGGGGHVKASGCEIKGSLAEVKQMMLKDIRAQLH